MQKTLIYIDISTGSQVKASGAWATAADYVKLTRGQWHILCIQFVVREVTTSGTVRLRPSSLFDEGTTSLLLVGDDNFRDEDNLMLKSYMSTVPFDPADPTSNRFYIEGDWIGGEFVTNEDGTSNFVPGAPSIANPFKGQCSVRINTDTVKFAEVLGNRAQYTQGLYINIKGYTAGLTNPNNIAAINFTAVNTIRDWSEATEEVPEGSALIPFIDSYLRNKIELEYLHPTDDGVGGWEPVFTLSATHYRFRIANTSTQWSDAIPIIQGGQGPQGPQGEPGTLTEEDKAALLTEVETHIEEVTLPELKTYVQEELANGSW